MNWIDFDWNRYVFDHVKANWDLLLKLIDILSYILFFSVCSHLALDFVVFFFFASEDFEIFNQIFDFELHAQACASICLIIVALKIKQIDVAQRTRKSFEWNYSFKMIHSFRWCVCVCVWWVECEIHFQWMALLNS